MFESATHFKLTLSSKGIIAEACNVYPEFWLMALRTGHDTKDWNFAADVFILTIEAYEDGTKDHSN